MGSEAGQGRSGGILRAWLVPGKCDWTFLTSTPDKHSTEPSSLRESEKYGLMLLKDVVVESLKPSQKGCHRTGN